LSSEGKTIIITTHYIEEARKAHTVGMMRSGIILSEDAPENLLKCYGCSTLEDVFLKLCVIDTSKVIQVNNLFYPGLELRSSTCKIYFLMLPTYLVPTNLPIGCLYIIILYGHWRNHEPGNGCVRYWYDA